MARFIRLTIVLLFVFQVPGLAQTTRDAKAIELADQVMTASGASNWPKLKRLAFTFNVEQNGKTLMSAKHDWDMKTGGDTVTWSGKTVTVKISDANTDVDAHAAMQRWTNDSYWLLAPLKLRDGGAMLEYGGQKTIDGKTFETLNLHFAGVGLTPGDRYTLYIEPTTHLVGRWDYMPTADKKISGTWEKYETFGGLVLATDHQFGDKRIFFTDVRVEN